MSQNNIVSNEWIVICEATGYVWEKKSREDAEYEVKAHFERYGHKCTIHSKEEKPD